MIIGRGFMNEHPRLGLFAERFIIEGTRARFVLGNGLGMTRLARRTRMHREQDVDWVSHIRLDIEDFSETFF